MSEDSGSSGVSNPLEEQSGETLVLWSAYALLAIWVIFEVIMEEYGLSTLTIALALLIAVVPRIDASVVETVSGSLAFSKLLGYLIVGAGVSEVIGDLRSSIFDRGADTFIPALIAWVAFFVAFWGARKIDLGNN